MKCKYCGKEFENRDTQKYCSTDCYFAYNDKKTRIKAKIKRLAEKYDFQLKNLDKIVNAKMMLFKTGDVTRCPCDADNQKRFCGSAQCIADTVYKGHCHCNLFHLKDSPIEPTME